ncbi:MAG: hypothetical protein IH944_12705 [Armatimonadetes bacterium]|nr:hypothetical protein [Armatimonadota bacterium]
MTDDKRTFWDKMEKVDRRWLYLILLVVTSAGLFIPAEIPVKPDKTSLDLYIALTEVPTDKVILVQSDWTNSTRGENAGHFEALLRYMMATDRKFVVYSYADPQAPQVSRDALRRIIQERVDANLKEYKHGVDYLVIGYFPNAEAQTFAMATNLRTAWGARKYRDATGQDRSIFDSPILADVYDVTDAGFLMIVTASNTIDVAVERLSDKNILIGCMCTGVVGPQVLPYHQAGQVIGIAIGLKGVYDFEYMMKYGVNAKDSDGITKVTHDDPAIEIPAITVGETFGRGNAYYATMHIALALLVLAVLVGNIGMAVNRRRRKS